MITEYENEPIPGLPGLLPRGERILWQGRPDWRVLARTAFHTGAVALYFAVLTLWAAIAGTPQGAVMTAIAGMLGVGLLYLLAWQCARTTYYTLTNKRIVLRIGMALPKCINLPLGAIGAVDLRARARNTGDLIIKLTGRQRLGYAALWPHARAWHYATPQPMLRAVPQVAKAGALIARTIQAAQGAGIVTRADMPEGKLQPINGGKAVAA